MKNSENLKLTTGQIVSKSSNKSKVINNFECYIATSINTEKAMTAKIGDKVHVKEIVNNLLYTRKLFRSIIWGEFYYINSIIF